MTIPYLTFKELRALLEKNGFKIISNQDWEEHNRIVFGKDDYRFPVPILEAYFYPYVVRLCRDFQIEPPPDHLQCHEQYQEYKKNRASDKEKEKGE
jgi:hypothetical protein